MTLIYEEMIEIAAQREAENEVKTQKTVIERIEEMCEVLRTNYQSHSIATHQHAITNGRDVEYHQKRIDELSEGVGAYNFTYDKGRKYAKIVMHTPQQRSAHAFVDLKTGDVYKSSSWKSPAKGVRYNLLDDKSREEMYQRADWAGSYLYK
jgi:hypothetical protein